MGRTLIGLTELEIDGEKYIIGNLQVRVINQLLDSGEKKKAISLAKKTNIELADGSCVSPPGPSNVRRDAQQRARDRKVVRPSEPSEFGPNVLASKEGQEAQALAQASLDEANAEEAPVEITKEPIVQKPTGFESAPADD